MKRIIILLITILLPMASMAEDEEIREQDGTVCTEADKFDTLMNSYSSQPGCTTINISNGMLETMDVAIGADYMKVISVENKELIPVFKEQVEELIGMYEVIMSVNSGGESVDIYQQCSENGSITDLFISTSNANSCVLIYIHGKDIVLSNIGNMINM